MRAAAELISNRRPAAGSCIVPVDGFFEWKGIKGQRASSSPCGESVLR
jgi:hypothetical protein